MQIGVTNLDGNSKSSWFRLEPGDNLYRVVPPVFSLAEKGQFAKYYATHSVWVQDPQTGKRRPYHFQCIEKVNRETKIIDRHCPFCDLYRTNLDKYNAGRESGMAQEALKEFHMNHVRPYQPEKKFYINAVNQNNEVGILPIGIKLFRSLQDRLMEMRNNYHMDATGTEGMFFNFKKIQKYKGDRDTTYQVDPAVEISNVNGVPSQTFRMHTLTTDFINNVLSTKAKDLGALFKEITAEDMAMIANASYDGKLSILERIFSRSDSGETTKVSIGGTNATAVGNVTLGAGGSSVQTAAPAPSMAPAMPSVLTAQAPAGAPAPLNPAAQQLTQAPLAPAAAAVMSDEDFVNNFMPQGE